MVDHDALIDQALKHPSFENVDVSEIDREALKKKYFFNYRKNDTGKGLRLSPKGFEIFKDLFKYYELALPEKFYFTGRMLLSLDKGSKLPYYISKTSVYAFEEEFAILLKLCDTDIVMVSEMRDEEGSEN